MMSPPRPKPPPQKDEQSQRTTFFGRDGLAAYTTDPASFPESRVVYYNDKFVVIRDLYPKSTLHLLILPRDSNKNILRPQEAFDDPEFLAECREEEQKVQAIAAAELRRMLGKYSATEQARNNAMELNDPPSKLPAGRDWSREIIAGTHANPSMNHLHIHVLSRDMHSPAMKKTNHYLSFTTDFLIPMTAYPLPPDDPRRDYGHFPVDMYCWYCSKNFKNKIGALKAHLEEEFEVWKKQ